MNNKGLIKLKTDTELLRLSSYETGSLTDLLEHELIDLNTKPTIYVWRGIIIDGHKRYNLCHKYNVPFNIRYLNFESKDDAIIWKCCLLITEKKYHTARFMHYYLGKYYVTEQGRKGISNTFGHNQFTPKELLVKHTNLSTFRELSEAIGKEAGFKSSSILKYAREYKYIEAIYELSPLMADIILSEQIQISYETLGSISKLTSFEMNKAERYVQSTNSIYIELDKLREYIEKSDKDFDRPRKPRQSLPKTPAIKPQIKVTPKFDPDAEIASLYLTIPSWISSMSRARNNTDFSKISDTAANKLRSELNNMQSGIQLLINELEVPTNE